jgi:hypothetical protein
VSDEPHPYRLKVITRCRIAGLRLVPGALLDVKPGKLCAAAHLVLNKTAVPIDDFTRREIELYTLLQRSLPPTP